jgi:hypothetical protein
MKIHSIPFDPTETDVGRHARKAKALSEIAQGRDAIFVVTTGQSNAYGSNHDGVMPEDFEVNDNVLAWDKTAGNFRKSEPRFYQIDGERLPTMVSYTHAFCVRLQKETGKTVYYLQFGYGSKSIVNWSNDRSDPNTFTWDIGGSLRGHINNAIGQLSQQHGIQCPDIWTWIQGETDAGKPMTWYADQFKTMLSRFIDAGQFYPGITPLLCGEMLKGGYGEPMREFYRNMNKYGIDYASVVSTDGLDNDGVSKVHLSGPSYWEFGYERCFNALIDDINNRKKVVGVLEANLPPASAIPDGMILKVDSATGPYIAVSDGAHIMKANLA